VWDTSDTGFFQSSDESYLSSSYGGAQDGSAISLNSDGTRVYYSDGDTLFQESLSTPFDLRTNNGVEATLDVNVGSGSPYGFGITWYDGGSKAYVSTGGRTSDGEQLLYTFSTRYDLDTATYQRSDFVPSGSSGSSAVDFNENGTKGYNGTRGQSTIYQYDLTTPFDLSTRTNTESTNIREDPIALRFEPSGEYLYTGHHSPNEVNRYKCSTNFDLTTVGSETTLRSNNGDNNGDYNGMFISGPAYY
jgi:hypothetical protein